MTASGASTLLQLAVWRYGSDAKVKLIRLSHSRIDVRVLGNEPDCFCPRCMLPLHHCICKPRRL